MRRHADKWMISSARSPAARRGSSRALARQGPWLKERVEGKAWISRLPSRRRFPARI